jgi:SEC-C motif domain protein
MTAKKNSSKAALKTTSDCPCGSSKSYAACCELLHNGAAAASAEALMRSRYSAFVLDLPDYLQRSWHHSVRVDEILENAEVESKLAKMRWLRLHIKRCESLGEDRAIVEFIAHYKIAGRAYALHETSRFVREGGHWFYIDGQSAD